MFIYIGLIGKPNLSGYCASKFAIVGMTEALGKEFKKIKIYSVCPRAVATSMSNHKGNSPVLIAKAYIKLLKGKTKIKNGGHFLVGREKDSRKVWKNGVPTVKLNPKS
jgi:short-subunit dehydrogenase